MLGEDYWGLRVVLGWFWGYYRVFFIEGQIRISYKILKIPLIHVGSGLRTELTMGLLISDQFKSPLYVINAHISLEKLQF